jgi:hypothetical protein
MRRPPSKTPHTSQLGRDRPQSNCPRSNSPGEREGGNGFALAGAAGGRVPPVDKSSDLEETCGGHVINGPKNSWLSLHVRN